MTSSDDHETSPAPAIRRVGRSLTTALLAVGVAVGLLATGCGNSGSKTAAPDTTAPVAAGGGPTTSAPVSTTPPSDPCAVMDLTLVQSILGPLGGAPTASSAMSGDGRGLVLNCVATSADHSRTVDVTQRLNMGRDLFEQNRAATSGVLSLGTETYWVTNGPKILTLDGEDLVAVTFRNVQVDQAKAEALLAVALSQRHAATTSTTAS